MKSLLVILLILCLDCTNSYRERQTRAVRVQRKIPPASEKRIACYYANWASYREGDSKFFPEDIHPHLCTHVLYAFATLEKDVGIVPFDPKQDLQLDGYAKFIELKKANPDLQMILSVGGSKEGPARFSKIAADPGLRSLFAKNGRAMLEQYGFDGLDLVWQYPNFSEGSSSSDKENYVKLVKEIKEVFQDDLGLSMAVPSLQALIDKGFDLPELTKYLDFMNVLTYNYHESTEPTVNHLAPLYKIDKDPAPDLNVDSTIANYLKLGVDPAKLNLGIPLYGVSFFLDDPEQTDIGSATEDEGPGLQEPGAIFYNDLCKRIKEELWTVRHVNKTAIGPYAYKDKRWVAFDDEDMVKTKARYAAEKKLGGLMFWTIDMDDFKGLCHSRAYPLIKAGRETFLTKPKTVTPKPPTRPPMSPTRPPMTPTKPPTRAPSRSPRPVPTRESTPRTPSTPLQPPGDNEIIPEKITSPDPSFSDNFPEISGTKTFHSNRDIIFQNVKISITNHYYPSTDDNTG